MIVISKYEIKQWLYIRSVRLYKYHFVLEHDEIMLQIVANFESIKNYRDSREKKINTDN